MAIVLRKVNKHSDQIRSLSKAIQRSQSGIPKQPDPIPSEGSQASCEVLQPLIHQPEQVNQEDCQAMVDTELKLN
jgi:hypothetical protein